MSFTPRAPRRARPLLRSTLIAMALTPPLGLVITPPARAAEPAAPQQQAGTANGRQMRPLANLLASMGRAAGVSVVADSSVTQAEAPLPAAATTPENVEQQLTDLAAALPQGTTWVRLYLPPARGRGYDGDALSQYVQAQARLVGQGQGAAAAGTVEFLGQRLPAEQAQPHLAGLGLQPVYLLTNPKARAASAGSGMDAGQWNAMTPEQRRQYASAQAAQLAAMDPASRSAWMQQNMMVFGQLVRQLPPDQRGAAFQTLPGDPNTRVMIRTNVVPGGAGAVPVTGDVVVLPVAPANP